jgi:hypothetical protein
VSFKRKEFGLEVMLWVRREYGTNLGRKRIEDISKRGPETLRVMNLTDNRSLDRTSDFNFESDFSANNTLTAPRDGFANGLKRTLWQGGKRGESASGEISGTMRRERAVGEGRDSAASAAGSDSHGRRAKKKRDE